MEEDQRFAHIKNDPKFRRIPKGERKVKIDKRFQSMFSDKKFKVKYTVDKRGRPVSHNSTEDLKRYYHLSSDEEQDSDGCSGEGQLEESGQFVKAPPSSDDETGSGKEELNVKLKSDKGIPENIKKRLKNLNVDYARGESSLFSESSSDEEESEAEGSESEDFDHQWGELDRDAEKTEEATHRLAACNMDWDRIRATDLMVLFNSFLPPGGVVNSIIIYPSEFGLKRLEEEEVKGPIELVEKRKGDEEGGGNEEGSKYHMEKLRQYQLNRLKYYYAVIDCDSIETANKLYTECDGLEYESSATKIDLRFIPDDMDFDQQAKEICDKLPEQGKYQPRFFTTTALQQAKVDLTWDETAPERVEITQKLASGKIDDLANEDLQNYLATSSEDEEPEKGEEEEDTQEETNPIDKYRALLQDIEKQEQQSKHKEVEMEISWGIDLKAKTDKMVKDKTKTAEEKTPFEQMLDKRKEKRKAKLEQRKNKQAEEDEPDSDDVPSDVDMNDPYFAEEFDKPEFKQKNKKKTSKPNENGVQADAELELLLLDSEEDNKKHFSLKKIQEQEDEAQSKKKRKKGKNDKEKLEIVDDFQINTSDDRFSALYTSHHYNIDPTDPHYKKTKGMEAIISEKLKRRNFDDDTPKRQKTENGKSKNVELTSLVKSIKRKTEDLYKRNNK